MYLCCFVCLSGCRFLNGWYVLLLIYDFSAVKEQNGNFNVVSFQSIKRVALVACFFSVGAKCSVAMMKEGEGGGVINIEGARYQCCGTESFLRYIFLSWGRLSEFALSLRSDVCP